MYISPTVPIGTPGRLWGVVWLSDDLAACLACFKRPPPRYPDLPKFLANLFSTSFFSQRLLPKVLKIHSPKSLQI